MAGDAATLWRDPGALPRLAWNCFDGKYFTGDGAERDEEGYFWILGRVDYVLHVSGHHISTTEIELALVSYPAVAQAALSPAPMPPPARPSRRP